MTTPETIDPSTVCPTCPKAMMCAAFPAPSCLTLCWCSSCGERVSLVAWYVADIYSTGRVSHLCRSFSGEKSAHAAFPEVKIFYDHMDYRWACSVCGGAGVSHSWRHHYGDTDVFDDDDEVVNEKR